MQLFLHYISFGENVIGELKYLYIQYACISIMKKQKSNHIGSSPPLYNGGNQDFKQGMLVVLCWSRWHVDRYETCFVFVFVFKLELWLLIMLLLLLIFIQLESTQVADYFDKSCWCFIELLAEKNRNLVRSRT